MSKTAKSATAPNPAGAELPFEEALQKLEAIVEAMESDALPLEGMLARFEEGMRLAEVCQSRLAAAEVRIQQLESTAGAAPALKPLAGAGAAGAAGDPE